MTKVNAILRRRWWILLIATLAGAFAGFGSAELGNADNITLYEAEDIVAANRNSGAATNPPQDALRIKRGDIPTLAAERLERPQDRNRLASQVKAKYDSESNSISIRVERENPEEAQRIVSAFSSAFIESMNEELGRDTARQLAMFRDAETAARVGLAEFEATNPQSVGFPGPLTGAQLNAIIDTRKRLLDDVSAAVRQRVDTEARAKLSEPYVLLGSSAPQPVDNRLAGVANSPPIRGGIMAILGLMLGIGLVLLIERMSRPVDTREELADIVEAPILTSIPFVSRKRMKAAEDGTISLDGLLAEHYRRIRSAIQFVEMHQELKGSNGRGVFLISSALPGEGKSTTVALTALALAEVGTDTLVVNADVRRPAVERMLGATTSPSLADRAVMDPNRPDAEDLVLPTATPHLFTVAGGPPTKEVGPRLTAAREIAALGRDHGGTVLIDSTPFAVANDTVDVLPAVDRVILVVRAGHTTRKALENTLETLRMHEAELMGVVLIGLRESRRTYYYYEQYYMSPTPKSSRRARNPRSGGEPVEARGEVLLQGGAPVRDTVSSGATDRPAGNGSQR